MQFQPHCHQLPDGSFTSWDTIQALDFDSSPSTVSAWAPAPAVCQAQNVDYIVVNCMQEVFQYEEQSHMTGRELLALAKFFQTVAAFQNRNLGSSLGINWSLLIENLNIQRHFSKTNADWVQFMTSAPFNTAVVILFDTPYPIQL